MLLFMAAHALFAQDSEVLSTFDRRSRAIYYDDRDIAMQAARFGLQAPVRVREITVTLSGPADGSARIRLFAGEGGAGAPFYGDDVMAPVIVRKRRAGVESISVRLSEPVAVESEQMFVGVDRLSPGTVLLSDSRPRPLRCIGSQDGYADQLLCTTSGAWRWGRYAYLIGVAVEAGKQPDNIRFTEIGAEAGIMAESTSNRMISWGDIDNNGFLDLLAGGNLFMNRGDGTFDNVTATLPEIEGAIFHCMLDQDRDGALDIIAIGRGGQCGGDICASLLRNDGHGGFGSVAIDLPGVSEPRCFSVTDLDGDGLVDLYIGQIAGKGSGGRAHLLYRNAGGEGFVPDSSLSEAFPDTDVRDMGAQFADLDGDSHADLFLAIAGDSASHVLMNDGTGVLHPRALGFDDPPGNAADAGCNWRDINGDGVPELLLPRDRRRRGAGPVAHEGGTGILAIQESERGGIRLRGRSAGLASPLDHQSGGGWADVDNDGLQDLIVTSSCACTPARLYMQTSTGEFRNATFESGLWGISLGPDLAWSDYDNDGAMDFCTFSGNTIRLFRNTGKQQRNNFVAIELYDLDGVRTGPGSRVTVHAGDERYSLEVPGGHGKGMQEPERLHFGTGSRSTVDSVVVDWAGGRGSEVFHDIRINRINRLASGRPGGSAADMDMAAKASPNPFSARVAIDVRVSVKTRFKVDIHTADGNHVRTIADGVFDAGSHQFIWDGMNRSGEKVAQGVYLFRVSGAGREIVGKIIRQE